MCTGGPFLTRGQIRTLQQDTCHMLVLRHNFAHAGRWLSQSFGPRASEIASSIASRNPLAHLAALLFAPPAGFTFVAWVCWSSRGHRSWAWGKTLQKSGQGGGGTGQDWPPMPLLRSADTNCNAALVRLGLRPSRRACNRALRPATVLFADCLLSETSRQQTLGHMPCNIFRHVKAPPPGPAPPPSGYHTGGPPLPQPSMPAA